MITKFEENGKTVEFDSTLIPTRWHSDTCDCSIIYDKNSNFLAVMKKCKIHLPFSKEILLNKVITHNQSFNLKFGKNPTKLETDEILNNRNAEKKRIENL